jgi:hypothetical protein
MEERGIRRLNKMIYLLYFKISVQAIFLTCLLRTIDCYGPR